MDTNRDYYLLLVDFRRFTRLDPQDAARILRKVEAGLQRINKRLRPRPVLGLTISYGDELAGLFTTPVRLFDIVAQVRDLLYPDARLRFVAARGRIAVPSRDIRRVGGEVFKTADQAMQRIKKRSRFCCWLLGDPVQDAVLTSLAELSNALLEEMTAYQREVFSLLQRDLPQKDVARRLKKHPQSVSDAAKRGKSELLLDAQRAIRDALSR